LKRFFSIFFVIIIIFQSFGLLLYFEAHQVYLKYTKLQRLNLNDKTTLILSFNQYLKAINSENEISFNGNMYDIVERTFIKEKVEITCIKDLKEDHILKSILGLFQHKNKKNEKTLGKIFKHIKFNYIDSITNFNFITAFLSKKQFIYLNNEYFNFSSPEIPPPNTAS